MSRALLAAAGLLALGGCAQPDEQPIAAGSLGVIARAAQAARRCGVRDTRFNPLDTRRAVLLLGRSHTAQAEACLNGWLHANRDRLDPALLARVRAA